MALCSRKFTSCEDAEIIRIIESAPTKEEGYHRAAQLLGRTYYSIQARYRRLKKRSNVKADKTPPAQDTTATTNPNPITNILDYLMAQAEAIVIQTSDYECRIVRTKDHPASLQANLSAG